ncbi:MAG: M56 family metallopeptidase [Actinobacteria bacterium]|nr:M56 family metallopeptidase [Actinomycetota bacterium]
MTGLLLVGAFLVLAVPLSLRPIGRRMPPARWARVCAVCLLAGAVLWQVGLVSVALPGVLRTLHAGGLANACDRVLGGVNPVVAGGLGWIAAVLVGLTGVRARRERRRIKDNRHRAHVEPWLGAHTAHDRFELVVLPCDEVIAISTDGAPAQVVVSAGLVETLTPEQLDAVVRHEAAHLQHRHARLLLMSGAIRSALWYVPVARLSCHVLETALERWADEEAAGPSAAERSVVREALWRVTESTSSPGVAAFAGPATIAERLDALTSPAPARSLARSLLVGASVVGAFGFALAALIGTRSELDLLAALTHLCPR